MIKVQFGNLIFTPVNRTPGQVAAPVGAILTSKGSGSNIWVSEIDPTLADTAAFCEYYAIGMDVSANCVVVEARRADKTWYAACLVLATTRADVNGVVRRELDARKISFAPMDVATTLTNMEYGGITPIGLPADWPILIDTSVMKHDRVIIGSGIRGSKILVAPDILATLPNAKVMEITKS
ncbi:MAG TPA: YbaK/EbsC family protein [Candidatus Saccharimonadales bacterium]